MKKELYKTPRAWEIPMLLESVLCTSDTTGEDSNPWTGDTFTAPIAPNSLF